ncbi:hypothetical protein BDR03DRAFT_1011450 [Suillus americanus]|nr:hypothetical protein BDR03DRAFT_1011450 [Suillus americanus]
MTAKSEAFDNSDSKSVASSPPSYDKIFTSGPVEQGQRPKPGARQTSCDDDRSMLATNIAKPGPPGLSIKSRRPSIFSFLPVGKQKRATVLSRVRDLVSAADSTPSSIDSIVNACASALTAAQLSDLLQTPNIEDHTALYWAIVNHRREVSSAFARFISNFSSECSSDLRLACMQTSNHALFSQLNLQNTDAKGESLRQFLGCPSDEIEVHEGGELDDHQFIASSRIRMFQKRLRTTQELKQEFVARGRV